MRKVYLIHSYVSDDVFAHGVPDRPSEWKQPRGAQLPEADKSSKWLVYVFHSLKWSVKIIHRCLLDSLVVGRVHCYRDFYGIFYAFKVFMSFFFFLQRKSFPSCLLLAKFQHVRSKISLFIWAQGLLTSRSNQTGTVSWTWRCQVSQSLT